MTRSGPSHQIRKQGTKMTNRTILLFLLVPILLSAQQTQDTKPEVLILTTGGTIASRTNAPLIAHFRDSAPGAPENSSKNKFVSKFHLGRIYSHDACNAEC